ncbi:MAG: hypothetical protein IJM51_01830 [Clostridia bacterium]|nr:hypothetical protein [Clostridia bacterium]
MNDIYSPSHASDDNSDLPQAPIAMPAGSGDIPELNFDIPSLDETKKIEDFDPDLYSSKGDTAKYADPDFMVPEITLPPSLAEEAKSFDPVLQFSGGSDTSFSMPEEDLTLPDMPAPAVDHSRVSKKSLSYETTVKIKNARHAERNEKLINEPVKKNARPVYAPKEREFNGIASGTAHVSGGLPELKDNQMYVAVTPKELRRLKSRKFRGLGVFATLCLAVIAAFCIWSYVNSFADPIVGRWKGNISSVALGIQALSEMDQDSMASTWEFNSSGSMYINLVLNDTPVSLSGSYEKLTDGDGEQYISMTLKNPMDNQDYTVKLYYTITGQILQFNDMDGVGVEIDLVKE